MTSQRGGTARPACLKVARSPAAAVSICDARRTSPPRHRQQCDVTRQQDQDSTATPHTLCGDVMAKLLRSKKRTWQKHKRGKTPECVALTDSIKAIFTERSVKDLKLLLIRGYIGTDEMLYNAEEWRLGSGVRVPRGWVSLLYLVIYHDWPDGFHYLLRKQANLERPVSHPPLALACSLGNAHMTGLIVQEFQKKYKGDALVSRILVHKAIREGQPECLAVLIQAGARINFHARSIPFQEVPERIAIDQYVKYARMKDNERKSKYLRCLQVLLDNGIDISEYGYKQLISDSISSTDTKMTQTLLCYIDKYFPMQRAKLLLSSIIAVNQAITWNNSRAIQLLLENGWHFRGEEDNMRIYISMQLEKAEFRDETLKILHYLLLSGCFSLEWLRERPLLWADRNYRALCAALRTQLESPLKLRDLCRIYIRQQCGADNVKKVHLLPLPQLLMEYLLFRKML